MEAMKNRKQRSGPRPMIYDYAEDFLKASCRRYLKPPARIVTALDVSCSIWLPLHFLDEAGLCKRITRQQAEFLAFRDRHLPDQGIRDGGFPELLRVLACMHYSAQIDLGKKAPDYLSRVREDWKRCAVFSDAFDFVTVRELLWHGRSRLTAERIRGFAKVRDGFHDERNERILALCERKSRARSQAVVEAYAEELALDWDMHEWNPWWFYVLFDQVGDFRAGLQALRRALVKRGFPHNIDLEERGD
jgi:hypothetical protein